MNPEAVVDQSLRDEIQEAYRRYLSHSNRRPRLGQKQMIAAIVRYLNGIEVDPQGDRVSPDRICVVEAGTGVGKTLAYLLSVLPLARKQGCKVLVCTATVTLQQQILEQEIPRLQVDAGLEVQAALAKGRRRYLCLQRLDTAVRHLSSADQSTLNLLEFAQEGGNHFSIEHGELYEELMTRFSDRSWNGDLDTLESSREVPPELLSSLTVDHRQCTHRKCPFLSQCPYYRAREGIERAELVVANHDLLLSDLALGGGVLLPNPQQTLLIIDEAHHLADKTLSHFANQLSLSSLRRTLRQLTRLVSEARTRLPALESFRSRFAALNEHLLQYQQHLTSLPPLLSQLEGYRTDNDPGSRLCRFPLGEVPDDIRKICSEQAEFGGACLAQAEVLLRELEKLLEGEQSSPLVDLTPWYQEMAAHYDHLQSAQALWLAFGAAAALDEEFASLPPPQARWIESRDEEDYRLHASPTDASVHLPEHLWSQFRGAVLCSATLSVNGNFRFLARSLGLPEDSEFHSLPSPFAYKSQGQLSLVDMGLDPADSDAYYNRLAQCLEQLIRPEEATLVLFSARRHLREVADRFSFDALPLRFGIQEASNRELILAEHRAAVAEGQGSCLWGLASFAEGLDLPGSELTHVIITRLPFPVPTDPIAETLAEWHTAASRNPFRELSLPVATLRLIQACGRLLRSEGDSGRISLLDRRILTRRYGHDMLRALPPFRRERVRYTPPVTQES